MADMGLSLSERPFEYNHQEYLAEELSVVQPAPAS
jgi:hypothetical protein